MNSKQVGCPRCGLVLLRKNLNPHLKRCGVAKPPTREPQRPCPACGTLITLSNRTRHLKACSPAHMKRKNEEPTPSTSKIARLDQASTSNEPTPSTSAEAQSSIATTVRSSIAAAFNAVKNAVGHLIGPKELEIVEIEKAFGGRMKTFDVENYPGIKDPAVFLEKTKTLTYKKILEHAREENIKVNFLFLAEFTKVSGDKPQHQEMNFKTKNRTILPTSNIEEHLATDMRTLLTEMEEFQAKGSGWTLHKIIRLQLAINRYVPLRGSTHMDLPKKIAATHAVINVQNNDNKCFLWAILAALHPVHWKEQPHRISNYLRFEHELDDYLDNITFPATLDHVKLFQKRSGMSINVYAYDDNYKIFPLLVADEEKAIHVDLLFMSEKGNTHYALIKDLPKLVNAQLSAHEHKNWICRRCLNHFGREDLLHKHKEYCNRQDALRIDMPEPGSTIHFKNYNNSMRVPFAIYADFECMLNPIGGQEEDPFIGPRRRYTDKYQKHEAVSFSYYVVHSEGESDRPCNYFGEDAPKVFVEHMLEESRRIQHLYSREAVIPMDLTEEEERNFRTSQNCHICGEPMELDRVRDHDHLTGKFRGAAHNACNLKYRKPKFIPVFIHNLSGYDTHLFIKMFGLNNETIEVIPNNEERYISYTIEIKEGLKLRFLDSLRFKAGSLDALVKDLAPEQFTHTSKFFSGDQLKLLTKKGIYPYDYMTDMEKFEETSLPAKEHFYNRLNMCDIEDKDYQHAQDVWNNFNINNMQEYTLLYNQTDVLLLADVMENFRDVCLDTYSLDPAWYFTSPGLAWDAMLKTTKIKLELLTDSNMMLMVGEGIRGGVAQCSHRHAMANNKFVEGYDESRPTTYLTYLDANNLYGWAMSQPMPYGNFEWVEDTDINIMEVPDDSPIGYILEVDLDYPEELHDYHSDLPLAPERRTPPGSSQVKLLTTLIPKEKYVIHYRNLKLYLSLGMKLRRIHRAISFHQTPWMKEYIDLNTRMRTQAKNDFEKDFFKLMNNSVFGKTMENIRNRVDIRLATQEKQVEKWMAKPNFKHRTIFAEHLAAIHMSKTRLLYNKAIYVGMSILDISKTLMYDFHYNVIKKKYNHNAKLLYMDTDSLTYLIQTEDLYEDMKEMIEYFDTSDYPDPNRYSMPRINKKVLGKMKDELCGRIMYEHVALRAKMYASRSEKKNTKDDGLIKKSKGVKKSVVKEKLTFKDYMDCLNDRKELYSTMNMIRSYKHDLYSIELNKISLSAADDKRYVMEDGISTLPWGHYAIPEDILFDLAIQGATEVE